MSSPKRRSFLVTPLFFLVIRPVSLPTLRDFSGTALLAAGVFLCGGARGLASGSGDRSGHREGILRIGSITRCRRTQFLCDRVQCVRCRWLFEGGAEILWWVIYGK